MIKVERRLPYNESFSTSGIDLEQSVIVVSFLEVSYPPMHLFIANEYF